MREGEREKKSERHRRERERQTHTHTHIIWGEKYSKIEIKETHIERERERNIVYPGASRYRY